MKKKPFEGLYKVLTMRSPRMAVSLIVFATTSFLVYKHCLTDMAFAAVVPLLLAHMYMDHKEKMSEPQLPDRGQL